MTYDEVLAQVLELLQRDQRVAYRVLKRRFGLDDAYVDDLKADLIKAKRLAIDEDGEVLVWTGKGINGEKDKRGKGEDSLESRVQNPNKAKGKGQKSKGKSENSKDKRQPKDFGLQTPNSELAAAERRQLTVMFCDLVGSTALSAQLDPEEYRELVHAYQQTSAAIIERFSGRIAQYLGDGLLVYFGYPVAHEDDAARAVRAGLEIVAALQHLSSPSPFQGEGRGEGNTQPLSSHTPHPNLLPQGEKELQRLQVRIGIHTGLVVVGEMGGGEKRELLALGETPNLAARIQGQAEPDTVFISAATYHLVEGLFDCEDRGQPALKGVSASLSLYRVLKEGEAQSRFQVVARKGLTPLVGREHEFGLLRERWEQVKDGTGQVVLLNGEPGIGKSRLVEALKETIEHEGTRCRELRCSPYHQNSALYPVIEHLQRVLQFQQTDSSEQKLEKLEQMLSRSRLDLQETVPLFASLLSLPAPRYTLPGLSPQKQKEKTHEAIVAWLCEEARQQAMTYAWEDLHWADPSTLELLTLFLNQVPTTRLLAVLTFRPEFTPLWESHSYLSQLTLSRLGQTHVEVMVEKVTGGKALPKEVVRQIASKTDGVPLFVEELTKTVLESVESIESTGSQSSRALQAIPIPTTLQDALMARLDRIGKAKEIAQIGATIGREFDYGLLHAVSPLNEEVLQQSLRQLVEAELVFQSGVPPQARYLFKHALVQDTAYQSLLKSRRQQLHQQVAQVLVEQFSQTVESQPELVAHHYTEAGLIEQAIPYWQQAGERAARRSAYVEAIKHLTRGLESLKTLPATPERIQQELTLQLVLAVPLTAVRGQSSPEVAKVYGRARELCQQVGETPQLFPVLWGVFRFHFGRAEYEMARELAEQLLRLAHSLQDPALLLQAHRGLGTTLTHLGEFASGRAHLEQAIALYDPQQHQSYIVLYGVDPGVVCRYYAAAALRHLGYPDQALKRIYEALSLARELSHPHSVAIALYGAAFTHLFHGEAQVAQERAGEAIRLCTEQGLVQQLAMSTIQLGCALAAQGQTEAGITQIHQGMAAMRATGTEAGRVQYLSLLAEVYLQAGQVEEGLSAVAEALALVQRKHRELFCEAELYRLKGELTLQQFNVQGSKFKVEEAEECFQKAIDIARRQQAKSFELRAATSLARLWQQQGKNAEAHEMLAELYNWFTEGLDTRDLQEAKALLESLEPRGQGPASEKDS